MRVEYHGEPIAKELINAAKTSGHSVVKSSNRVSEAVIVSGAAKKDISLAQKAVQAHIPVLYCHPAPGRSSLVSLFNLVLTSDSPFYIPYNRRLNPAYSALIGQVDAGKIGNVGFIKIHLNQTIPKGYAPGHARSCSTLVLSEMIHDIDWLNMNFGPVRTVFCQGVQKTTPATEYAMASFTLKNGVIAQVIHSYQTKVEPSLRIEICGNDGIVQYDSAQVPIRQTPRPTRAERSSEARDQWSKHWLAFEEMISNGKSMKKRRSEFAAPIRIAQATIESILSGEPKKV